MEIIWGDFYLQCSSSNATLIIAIPLFLILQLPPFMRLLSKLREKAMQSSAGQRLAAHVKSVEENE